jgi:hypothetical protein
MYKFIIHEFPDKPGNDYDGQSTMTTKLYQRYNLLMYPAPQMYELYEFISKAFRHVSGCDKNYFIQCWLNVYKKGDFIDWHVHWPKEAESWHGYFGVDVKDSVTTYKIPTNNKQVDVVNQDGQVIISPSSDDAHRTWPWPHDEPRITVAFDIVPDSYFWEGGHLSMDADRAIMINHWLPVAKY